MGLEKLEILVVYVAVLLTLSLFLTPLLFLVTTSFKTAEDIINPPLSLNFKPTLENWEALFANPDLLRSLGNSLTLIASVMVICTVVGSLAAYSVSRFRVGGQRLRVTIISTNMMPTVAIALPMYLFSISIGMQGSLIFLILVHSMINLPICFLIMTSAFDAIPRELDEAAMLDGCSAAGAIRRVILPLAAPAMAATAIIIAVFSWNEFMLALILTSTYTRTIAVFAGTTMGYMEVYWGKMAAAGTLIIVPPILGAYFMQKYIVRGLTLGSVKG